MENERQLREEIRERVAHIYALREAGQQFVPGESKVHYAGRVYDAREMQAMVDSVLDFWLTLGAKGKEFVAEFCGYMGMRHGLVVNSGSSANLVAVGALCSPHLEQPMRPGDEVITPASAFPTTLNPILQYGLLPVFVDIEEDTYNIDAAKIEEAITERTRAIVFAHTLGNPAELDAIMAIADKYGLYVIEDSCDALDSRYDGRLCGTFGHLSTYSFYAAHHISMGEGGAVLTNDPMLYRQALSLRDWGRACYCQTGELNPDGACGRRFSHHYEQLPFGYDHKYVYDNIGYNLKPLDIQCAMGLEQLRKLPDFTARRKRNFRVLTEAFAPYEGFFLFPRALPKADPSWFALPLTLRDDAPFTRAALVSYLEASKVETRMLFAGNILKNPGYRDINCRIVGELRNTEQVLHHTFFIGVYPGLDDDRLGYVIDTMARFMAQY